MQASWLTDWDFAPLTVFALQIHVADIDINNINDEESSPSYDDEWLQLAITSNHNVPPPQPEQIAAAATERRYSITE